MQLGDRLLATLPAEPTTFVEVTPPRRDQGHFEVVVGGGRVIRVPADFDAAALSRLVTVLEERC